MIRDSLLLPSAALAVLVACGGETEGPTDGGASGGGATTGGGSGLGGSAGSSGAAGRASANCDELRKAYADAASEARSCSPGLSSMQCQTVVSVGLDCSCPDVVNERNPAAIAELSSLATQYGQAGCRRPVACGMCLEVQPVTTMGGCSPSGVCLTSAST